MALASAYGLQYSLPQGQAAQQAAQDPSMLPLDYGDTNLLSNELYVKEGVTDEYFKKVAALKSFANEVSSRYGFDVTRPNYRNPDSIRFHRSYMEALAGLQADQNRLKRLASQENLSLQNPNIVLRDDQQGQTYATNVGENDIVKRVAATATQVKSREGAEAFGIFKENLLEQLNEEMSSAQTPQERDQLASTIRSVQGVSPDVGMSDAQLSEQDYRGETLDLRRQEMDDTRDYRNRSLAIEQQKADTAAKAGSVGKLSPQNMALVQNRIQTLGQVMNPESLKTLGFNRVDRESGTYLEKTINGKTESVKINPNDLEGTLFNLNDLINKSGKGSPISMDLLNELPPEFLQGMSQDLIGSLNPVEDKYSKFLEGFDGIIEKAKTNPTVRQSLASSLNSSGVKIPAEIAARFSNGLAEDSLVESVEESGGILSKDGIKIRLKKKRNDDPARTLTLYPDDPAHNELLKEIFRTNERVINISPNLYGATGGTVIAPSGTGGPSIDLDKF